MEDYTVDIIDTNDLFSINKDRNENQYDIEYSFGDESGEESELSITIDDYSSEITNIHCFKKNIISALDKITSPNKDGLERRPNAPFFPPKDFKITLPFRKIGDFDIDFSPELMEITFKNGEPKSYYEGERLVAFYDENDDLLLIEIKNITEEEYNKLIEYKKKQTEQYGIRK